MVKVQEYFQMKYGSNLELIDLEIDCDGVIFVSRTSRNNGVVARVKKIPGASINPANTISVATGGSVMESFLQTEPYYSGRDIYWLKPKIRMTTNQMLFYCMCLRANKFRYNYNRQANKTLHDIDIPSLQDIPDYVDRISMPRWIL